jgi:hypothetical protein
MFKPLTRSAAKSIKRPQAGFAETQFLHDADDADYSGFAPTEMFDDRDADALAPVASAGGASSASRAAASTSRSALARAAHAPAESLRAPAANEEPLIPASWVTSQWVAAQEAKAHEAAHQARLLIAAQRRGEAESGTAPAGAAVAARTGFGRLRAALERLLPGEFRSLLPLFICVSVTMALISAVLPLLDKP